MNSKDSWVVPGADVEVPRATANEGKNCSGSRKRSCCLFAATFLVGAASSIGAMFLADHLGNRRTTKSESEASGSEVARRLNIWVTTLERVERHHQRKIDESALREARRARRLTGTIPNATACAAAKENAAKAETADASAKASLAAALAAFEAADTAGALATAAVGAAEYALKKRQAAQVQPEIEMTEQDAAAAEAATKAEITSSYVAAADAAAASADAAEEVATTTLAAATAAATAADTAAEALDAAAVAEAMLDIPVDIAAGVADGVAVAADATEAADITAEAGAAATAASADAADDLANANADRDEAAAEEAETEAVAADEKAAKAEQATALAKKTWFRTKVTAASAVAGIAAAAGTLLAAELTAVNAAAVLKKAIEIKHELCPHITSCGSDCTVEQLKDGGTFCVYEDDDGKTIEKTCCPHNTGDCNDFSCWNTGDSCPEELPVIQNCSASACDTLNQLCDVEPNGYIDKVCCAGDGGTTVWVNVLGEASQDCPS